MFLKFIELILAMDLKIIMILLNQRWCLRYNNKIGDYDDNDYNDITIIVVIIIKKLGCY